MSEKFGGDWPIEDTGITKTLFEEISADMSERDWKYLKQIVVEDAHLDHPDARCTRVNDLGLIGIDYRLYLLIHNAAVLLFATKGFEIPGCVAPNTSGIEFHSIQDSIIEDVILTARGQIGCNDETILPSNKHLVPCLHFMVLAELFIVGHEIGHLVLSDYESKVINHCSQAHSFLSGFTTSGEDPPTRMGRQLDNWVSECLADRYAAELLMRYLGPPKEVARELCAVVFSFLFHLMDTYIRAVVLERGDVEILQHHPPPYSRLQFCGVSYQLIEPHVKYFGPQPFRMIAKLFDSVGLYLDLCYSRKFSGTSRISPYGKWATRLAFDSNLFSNLETLVAQVESAYRDDVTSSPS